jgi:hypothetical protein
MILTGETEAVGAKPVPLPLCAAQIIQLACGLVFALSLDLCNDGLATNA